MPKSVQLDKTFRIIIERMIATGQDPNYTEIAAELGVSPSEGRKVVRKLFSTPGFPGWYYPKTDDIASFAPFSTTSNYRLTIEGKREFWEFWGHHTEFQRIRIDCESGANHNHWRRTLAYHFR